MQANGNQKRRKSKQAKLLQFSRKRLYGFGIPDNRFENEKNTLIQGGNSYRTQQITGYFLYNVHALSFGEERNARRDRETRQEPRLLRYVGREQYLQVYDHGRKDIWRRSDEVHDARISAKEHGRVQSERNVVKGRSKGNQETRTERRKELVARVYLL